MKRSQHPAVLVVLISISIFARPAYSAQGNHQKLHPQLQMLVNATRSLQGPALQSASGLLHDAIIMTDDPNCVRAAGIHVNSVYPGFVTARVRVEDLERLTALNDVHFIDPGNTNTLQNDVSAPETGAPLVNGAFVHNSWISGQNVIVLIYDTGIDWKHKDFRSTTDTTQSRILALWDQTLTATGGETLPSGFSYGVEYTQAQINNEIDGTPAGSYTVEFNARGLASGVYFYRIEVNAIDNGAAIQTQGSQREYLETRRMLLVK